MTACGRLSARSRLRMASSALVAGFRAAAARSREFLLASFAPTWRERDALTAVFAAVAAASVLRHALD